MSYIMITAKLSNSIGVNGLSWNNIGLNAYTKATPIKNISFLNLLFITSAYILNGKSGSFPSSFRKL